MRLMGDRGRNPFSCRRSKTPCRRWWIMNHERVWILDFLVGWNREESRRDQLSMTQSVKGWTDLQAAFCCASHPCLEINLCRQPFGEVYQPSAWAAILCASKLDAYLFKTLSNADTRRRLIWVIGTLSRNGSKPSRGEQGYSCTRFVTR